MSRGECTFRQRDVSAALKAARDAGFNVARVEIDKKGKIVLIPGKPSDGQPDNQQGGAGEWEEK